MTAPASAVIRFLVYKDALGPIFSSVYLRPAVKLTELGLDSGILALSSPGEFVKPRLVRRWREFTAEATRRLGRSIQRLPTAPGQTRILQWDALLVAAWARHITRSGRRPILHCGGSYSACIALRARRMLPGIVVVYQSWGPEAAEILHASGDELSPQALQRARAADHRQRRAIKESDIVVSISKRMTEWARQEFGLNDGKVVEVPCFVDSAGFATGPGDRQAARQALGFGDEPVIAYCGSMLSWQLPPRSLEVLHAALKLNPATRFLGITMHRESLRRRLAAEGFPADRSVVVSVPHGEVPKYLAAADLGIIGRGLLDKPSLVNEVSSPIKFGEYLAAGTPVLISEGVGDFSQEVKENRLGIAVPFHAAGRQLEQELHRFWSAYLADPASFRTRCQQYARRELDIDSHVRRLAATYLRLSSSGGETHDLFHGAVPAAYGIHRP